MTHALTADEIRTQSNLGDDATSWSLGARALGFLGLVIAGYLGYSAGDEYEQFLHSYLVAFTFFQSIALGCLFFVIVNHLTSAKWSITVRRIAETVAAAMPLMAVLSLPILIPIWMGNHSLYEWTDPAAVSEDHLLHHKAPFLNVTFFTIRVVIYFAIWIAMSKFYLNQSRAQDQSGDPMITAKLRSRSAPFMILFALTSTFFAFDFLMSIEAHWFSTIFGVYFFAGATLSSFCIISLLAMFLQERGRLKDCVTTEHYQDLGKFTFAFVVFWGYIAFSQFMLIWYADLPEETYWFKMRYETPWDTISMALVFGHMIIPFIGLMSRHIKRNKGALAFWSFALLTMHYLDHYWLVMPSLHPNSFGFGAVNVVCLLGIGGLFLGGVLARLGQGFLTPVRDPYFADCLRFKNY